MPARSEAKQVLEEFARDEVRRFKGGEIDNISSIHELSARFGYRPLTVTQYLSYAGIGRERVLAMMEFRRRNLLIPSREWAWMLGLLAGGGNVDSKAKRIGLAGNQTEVLEAFKTTGERLFKSTPSEYLRGGYYNQNKYRVIEFHSTIIPPFIGDLRYHRWVDTIANKHRWILDRQDFTWGFLEGYFERRGVVSTSFRERRISLRSGYTPAVYFLADLLTRVGILRPAVSRPRREEDSLRGVGIHNLRDLKLFAEHVHSVVPEQEEKLNYFKRVSILKLQRPRQIPSSEDEVIDEWIQITQQLGRSPSVEGVQQLAQDGSTKFSPQVYITRFGRSSGHRSFVEARKKLEQLVFEKEVNSALRSYEHKTGAQIRYVTKIHRPHEEQAKARLEEILSFKRQEISEVVLFGPTDKPLVISDKGKCRLIS